MSRERALKLLNAIEDTNNFQLIRKVSFIETIIRNTCTYLFSIHRNYVLATLENLLPNYENCYPLESQYGVVRFQLSEPTGMGLFDECYGYEYKITELTVSIYKLYLIEGDLVRMKYREEKI